MESDPLLWSAAIFTVVFGGTWLFVRRSARSQRELRRDLERRRRYGGF